MFDKLSRVEKFKDYRKEIYDSAVQIIQDNTITNEILTTCREKINKINPVILKNVDVKHLELIQNKSILNINNSSTENIKKILSDLNIKDIEDIKNEFAKESYIHDPVILKDGEINLN
jgi:hypothetical protein